MNFLVQNSMEFILEFCSQNQLPILKRIESRSNTANLCARVHTRIASLPGGGKALAVRMDLSFRQSKMYLK
jgi:hypothetical protein